MIEIFAVGGYEECGRNCTAVRYKDDIVIFDFGYHMERVVSMSDEEHPNISEMSLDELKKIDAVPNDDILYPHRDKVVGIVSNHGHLDHIGAIPAMAPRYKAPVISTPYTIALIDDLMAERRLRSKPKTIVMKEGEQIDLSRNITLEFVRTTHSIPNTVFSVLHTPEGAVVYCNDYKLDNYPILEEKPDYKRIRQIGKKGVKAMVVETVRIDREQKTPSESVARALLEDVLLNREHQHALFVTTFASHIQRIKSVMEIAEQMGRELVLLGRSMVKYSSMAQKIGLINLPKNTKILGRGKAISAELKKLTDNRDKYLFLCTGHQGEPGSVLTRLANNKFPYKPEPGDEVIFSSSVIPSPINRDNHYRMTSKLKHAGARIFQDVHTSGHAAKEDHRDLLQMFRPEHIIPCHGDLVKLAAYAELASEMNLLSEYTNRKYNLGQNVHLFHNGQRHQI